MTFADPPNAPRPLPDAQGGMEQAPLVYALVHALDRAITGEMRFQAPAGEAVRVTFFEGAPVRVEPGPDGDRIGEDLVAMNHVREEDLALALVAAGASRRRLGELLVQAGAVQANDLTQALTLQTAKRLALLANLPPESTFSLYFSARAEPEPHAPWAPLDLLLATVRAWQDRTRLHGTLRWLADKRLSLSAEADLGGLMLTSREQDAVALMQRDAPSLRTLYATVGKGLSSLLYMLAVTRQFSFTRAKGAPMGRRRTSDLIREVVQVAVPIAPAIATMPEAADDTEEVPALHDVRPSPVPVPPEVATVPMLPADPVPVRTVAKVSVPASVRVGPEAEAVLPVAPVRVAPPARVAPPVRTVSPFPGPAAVAAPAPPARIPDTASTGPRLSLDFQLADDAAKRQDFTTADEILRERCTDEDSAEPAFQALAAWVKANLTHDLTKPLNDLTFLLMAHPTCESALYYRGMLLKRVGKEKAALRDFVTLAKANPAHVGALVEIKALREGVLS